MDEREKRLRALLDQQNYPSVYLFKFIIKNEQDKMLEIKKCFDEVAEFEIHPSKNGNYISLSIKQMMMNTEDIMVRYERVGKIENVIML
ncbi:MAG: DUF493 family protein [Crocinitomicaceae bacterium]|nr:DUF493 family protein [Crocinitomicaceae bacterium]MBK8924853.1 DUF493 family protein [Crocinitomicaceae bacterium]